MSPSPRFLNRHIVITGAGTGIGRAISLRLGREGARLTLLGRRIDPLAEVALAIHEAGNDEVQIATCDVTNKAQLEEDLAESVNNLGPLYALIANAGIGGPNYPGEFDRWEDLITTNLSGTYYCFRGAEKHLEEGPGPRHLLATSSVLGRFGVSGYTGYCASKAGILGLVRAMALELAPRNVQVNALCPGWVDTEMAKEGIQLMADSMEVDVEETHRRAMAAVPLGRMGTPEQVAGMVAWLLSEDAVGVTGQGLDMNGGAWMQ